MYWKQKRLAVNCENLAKIYVIENKMVSQTSVASVSGKNGGKKMGLSFVRLLKTNVEKMSAFRLSTMSLKNNELCLSLHDVDENKWVTENRNDKLQVASRHGSKVEAGQREIHRGFYPERPARDSSLRPEWQRRTQDHSGMSKGGRRKGGGPRGPSPPRDTLEGQWQVTSDKQSQITNRRLQIAKAPDD
jgi:hypothetical protein